MCLWSEMGDAWNARREKLRIWYPMHRQKSQETGGFMKKTKHPTVCGPFPACPCVHCLCSEPSHRVWHRAVLTLHSHPGALPWGSVSCPPAHTAPSRLPSVPSPLIHLFKMCPAGQAVLITLPVGFFANTSSKLVLIPAMTEGSISLSSALLPRAEAWSFCLSTWWNRW